MEHFTFKFWFSCGIAALAALLLSGVVASAQNPTPPSDDIVLSGFLTCPVPNGSPRPCPFRVHYVNLTAGKSYTIRMASSEFHASLTLEDMRGNLLAMDCDDFSTMPGCIVFHPPTTGSYRLIATSSPPRNEGFYTITVRELNVLVRMEATLMPSDAVEDGTFQKTHELTLIEGKRYVIDLASNEFVAFVKLLNPDGAIVAFDDEGCMPRPARIVFTASRTGTYRLIAASATPFATGAFTLTVCEE